MSPPAKQLGVASPHWHGRSRLWWSNLTYVPVSYTAWHDPLISKVQGSKPAICPKAEVQKGPHCAPLHSPWPSQLRCQGAEGDIPTFCRFLSLYLCRSSTLVNSRVRFILRKLGSKRGTALPTLTTKRGGESLVCLFTMWKRSRGERVCMSVSNRQHLALNVSVCVSLCMHSLPTRICLYPLAVCARGRQGWAGRCSK